jgi:3-(3-hydroxy-phenyl)propionate hydroxylase
LKKSRILKLSEEKWDIVIIGLGPVGATLTNLLNSYGVRCLAVDASSEVYDLPRAIGLDQEALRAFQQIGIIDQISKFVDEYKSSEYRTKSGEIIRKFLSPPPPHHLGWPPYATFVQPEIEVALRENIENQPNIELTSYKKENTLKFKDTNTDQIIQFKSRFVIGCDGGNSFVRKKLGIQFDDLGFDQSWLVLDLVVADTSLLPNVNIQYCDPARPHTYIVGPGKIRRWEFMLLPGETPAEVTKPEKIWSLLEPWITQAEAKIWRTATYRFHALIAQRWRQNNVILAGDACHMTPPFLAQGMVQGIKDAINLSWKLAAVIKGAPDSIIDSYEQERSPLVREIISITKELGLIICETDIEKTILRDEAMLQKMRSGSGETIRQDLFPPLSASDFILHSIGKGTGKPSPQPEIKTNSGWQLLDEITGHRFHILATPEFSISETLHKSEIPIYVIGKNSSFYRERDHIFSDWMKSNQACAALIRPDHQVMATFCESKEIEDIILHLKNSLRA